MSFGLYDPHRRYRRRLWVGFLRFGFYIVALGGVGLFAYQIGVQQDQTRIGRLEAEIAALSELNAVLEDNARRYEAVARRATSEHAEMQRRYERDMPTDEEWELLALIEERVAEGVPLDRVTLMIRAAAEPRNCQILDSRRFILPNAGYRGPNTTIGFAGQVSITGWGEAARSAAGASLAYFDPSQPVTIRFADVSGRESEATGLLPLTHSVLVGEAEWRFLVDAGERSFVTVSAQRCDAP